MSTYQEARAAWFEREVIASARLVWPMTEPQRVHPAQDPQYPYDRAWENRAYRVYSDDTPEGLASYERSQRDDFDPDHHERLYVPLNKASLRSGEGAIYTPEYLRRTGA